MSGKKVTYEQKVKSVLTDTPKTIQQIMDEIKVPSHKTTYVIAGIKKLIENGEAKKITNPTEKRAYLGHTYVTQKPTEQKQ